MKLRNRQTGKVYTLSDDLYIEYTQGGKIELRVIIPGGSMSNYYDSLAELYEEWEDYKPKEPLIKDEKIRKAVRAWAEASDIEAVYLSSYETLCWIEGFAKIEFAWNRDWFKELEEGKRYTITELCGEEKE